MLVLIVRKRLKTGATFPLTSGFPDQYTRIPDTSLLEPMLEPLPVL